MQELITRLTQKVGISPVEAIATIETIKEFVKEKFPMLSGAVDNMFASSYGTGTAPGVNPLMTETSIMDKISDVIPGATGQKIEDFAKNAADKAEDAFDSVKDKLGEMFGGQKNKNI